MKGLSLLFLLIFVSPLARAQESPILKETELRLALSRIYTLPPAARLNRAINEMVTELRAFNPDLDTVKTIERLRRYARMTPTRSWNFWRSRANPLALNALVRQSGDEAGDQVVKSLVARVEGTTEESATAARAAVKLAIGTAILNGAGHGPLFLHRFAAMVLHTVVFVIVVGTLSEIHAQMPDELVTMLTVTGVVASSVAAAWLLVVNMFRETLPAAFPKIFDERIDSAVLNNELERDFWPRVRMRVEEARAATADFGTQSSIDDFLTTWDYNLSRNSKFTSLLNALKTVNALGAREIVPFELPDCRGAIEGR